MNSPKIIPALAVLTVFSFSGCCAVMMPAMMLGHGAHRNANGTQDKAVKSCDCDECMAPKSDAQALRAAAPSSASVASPPSSPHNH